jgi:hypothetical protein
MGKKEEDAKKKAKTPRPKRLVVEIAPGVRAKLDAHISAFNENPDRASTPLKYTDVINRAVDLFLTRRDTAGEASDPV